MKLLVKKYPSSGAMAECIEVTDDALIVDGFELLTVEEYEAWRLLPEQVNFSNACVLRLEQERDAKLADAKVKQDAQIAQLVPVFGEELARKIVLSNQ